jgi:hypothetical protein
MKELEEFIYINVADGEFSPNGQVLRNVVRILYNCTLKQYDQGDKIKEHETGR